MAWFATVNVFTLGAVVANRLELSLMTRFRQWAEANGTLMRVRVASTSSAELPTATFPNAHLAYPQTQAISLSGEASFCTSSSTVPRPPSSAAPAAPSLPPGITGGGLGLISKHHLAVFWDSLEREERWKIVIGNDTTGAAAMVHGGAAGDVSGAGGPAGRFGAGSGLRFSESGSGAVSGAKSVTGGGSSAKSVTGGKSRRRGGAHSGVAARTDVAAPPLTKGTPREVSGVAVRPSVSASTEPEQASMTQLVSEQRGQDTLGPLPHFAKAGTATKAPPPFALKPGTAGGVTGRATPIPTAVPAASSAGTSSEGAASETTTYATVTLQASIIGGRLTAGGSSSASIICEDDSRLVPLSSGAASRLVIPATLVSGSSSAAAVYSGQVSESGDVDESTGHSVGYSGQGPLAQADLFSQGPEQLRHMWPFCLVDKDGVTVVQVSVCPWSIFG